MATFPETAPNPEGVAEEEVAAAVVAEAAAAEGTETTRARRPASKSLHPKPGASSGDKDRPLKTCSTRAGPESRFIRVMALIRTWTSLDLRPNETPPRA
jgi:hypothetical protein